MTWTYESTDPKGISMRMAKEVLLTAAHNHYIGAGCGVSTRPEGEEERRIVQALRRVHLDLYGWDKKDW